MEAWISLYILGPGEKVALDRLRDGHLLSRALGNILPDRFQSLRSRLGSRGSVSWLFMKVNLRRILISLQSYFRQYLGVQINDARIPDIFRIARDGDKNEIIKLLSLILGCAVTCRDRLRHVENIMGLQPDDKAEVLLILRSLDLEMGVLQVNKLYNNLKDLQLREKECGETVETKSVKIPKCAKQLVENGGKQFSENGCQTTTQNKQDGWTQSNLPHPRVDALRKLKRERSGRIKNAGYPAGFKTLGVKELKMDPINSPSRTSEIIDVDAECWEEGEEDINDETENKVDLDKPANQVETYARIDQDDLSRCVNISTEEYEKINNQIAANEAAEKAAKTAAMHAKSAAAAAVDNLEKALKEMIAKDRIISDLEIQVTKMKSAKGIASKRFVKSSARIQELLSTIEILQAEVNNLRLDLSSTRDRSEEVNELKETLGSLLKKNVKIMSENDALRQRIENLEDGLRMKLSLQDGPRQLSIKFDSGVRYGFDSGARFEHDLDSPISECSSGLGSSICTPMGSRACTPRGSLFSTSRRDIFPFFIPALQDTLDDKLNNWRNREDRSENSRRDRVENMQDGEMIMKDEERSMKDGEVVKFDPSRYLDLEREAERLVDLVGVMEDREEQILAEVKAGRTEADIARRRVRELEGELEMKGRQGELSKRLKNVMLLTAAFGAVHQAVQAENMLECIPM